MGPACTVAATTSAGHPCLYLSRSQPLKNNINISTVVIVYQLLNAQIVHGAQIFSLCIVNPTHKIRCIKHLKSSALKHLEVFLKFLKGSFKGLRIAHWYIYKATYYTKTVQKVHTKRW